MQVTVTFAKAPRTGREGGTKLYKDVVDTFVAERILRLTFADSNGEPNSSVIIPLHNILLVETEV